MREERKESFIFRKTCVERKGGVSFGKTGKDKMILGD